MVLISLIPSILSRMCNNILVIPTIKTLKNFTKIHDNNEYKFGLLKVPLKGSKGFFS